MDKTDKINNTISAIEAINEFYRFKDKYERGYNEKYVTPIVKSKKTNKDKRIAYSKLPKPECINCKRNVGTIFTIHNDKEEDIRKFIAKCGDITDPCPLNIQINSSFRDNLNTIIITGSKSIEKIKLDIIKEKNNALFFNKDVVSSFEKITSTLKTETENVGFAIETNILRNNNPEKYALIKKNNDEFGKGFLLPFKQMIANYMDTNNENVLNNAVKFYVDEMIPKLKQIQEMTYEVNFVEYNPTDKIYNLIQYENSLENNEFFVKDDDKVVSFIKGVKKDKTKTLKQLDKDIPKKNKTKKIKPIGELVIEDGEMEEYEGKDERVDIDKNKDKVNDLEYNKTIKSIPTDLLELLEMDKQWLDDYIYSCIDAKKNRKPCELFLPRQTKFPPEVLEDGTYDFNSVVVNKLFNSINDKDYQTKLLRLYTEKNGVKNYNLLNSTLLDLLTRKIINYNNGYF